MKKILALTAIIISIVISGCGNKEKFSFNFEDFHGNFITSNSFSTHESEIKGLAASLLTNDIIASYTQTQHTGYTDSIVIVKKNNSKTLEDFVSQNIKKIQIEGYSFDSTKYNTIKCNEEKIETQIINSELDGNLTTTFFHQTFFVYAGYTYIISFSSEEENERDNFASSTKNIKCNALEEINTK